MQEVLEDILDLAEVVEAYCNSEGLTGDKLLHLGHSQKLDILL